MSVLIFIFAFLLYFSFLFGSLDIWRDKRGNEGVRVCCGLTIRISNNGITLFTLPVSVLRHDNHAEMTKHLQEVKIRGHAALEKLFVSHTNAKLEHLEFNALEAFMNQNLEERAAKVTFCCCCVCFVN